MSGYVAWDFWVWASNQSFQWEGPLLNDGEPLDPTSQTNFDSPNTPYSRKFCGVQFSWIVNLYHFVGLIFADARIHAHYVLYN